MVQEGHAITSLRLCLCLTVKLNHMKSFTISHLHIITLSKGYAYNLSLGYHPPLSGERGLSSVSSLALKRSPKYAIRAGQQPETCIYNPPKNQGLMLEGCWMSFGVCLLRWYLGREIGLLKDSLLKERDKGSCGRRYCCGSREIQKRLLWERPLLWQWERER